MKRPVYFKAILLLLLVSFLLSISSPAYALERNATGYTVVDSRQYPIIFIPGMAGSTLDVGGGDNAWPGSLSTNDEAFKVLALKEDGRTPLHGVRPIATDTVRYGLGDVTYGAGDVLSPGTKSIISKVVGGVVGLAGSGLAGPGIGSAAGAAVSSFITGDWQHFPVYQGFYEYMENEGYKLNDNPTGKVFYDFPYDFRQDNKRWTKLLDKKVDKVLRETKADKVILVGHSMGGLQARLYMKDAKQAKKVAAVVFMGTPHHGSVMPFWAMTEGYNFGNKKLSNARMWEIAGNWEGGYQLLPDFDFILNEADFADDPAGLRWTKNVNPNTEWAIGALKGIDWINTETWMSAQEFNRATGASFLQAQEGEPNPSINYGLPNWNFAHKSVEFHKELGGSVDKYPWVKYYGIRGTGQSTVQALAARFVEIDARVPKPVLRLEKIYSNLGDGTVPPEGARIDGLDKEYEVVSEHGAIPSNAEAQKIMTNIRKEINNEDFRNDLVKKMGTFARAKLAQLRRPPRDDDGAGYFRIGSIPIWKLLTPDQIKLRDELRNMALEELRNVRANITIATGADKNELGADKPEHLYIDIVNYEVRDAGLGVISGATMNIKVDSLITFEEALTNPDILADATFDGSITVEGTGVVDKLKAKVLAWVGMYIIRWGL